MAWKAGREEKEESGGEEKEKQEGTAWKIRRRERKKEQCQISIWLHFNVTCH